MNKKTIKIAGWALGLSMAVAGIGAAVNAAQKSPMEAKAATNTVTFSVAGWAGNTTGNSYISTATAGTGSVTGGGTVAASMNNYIPKTGQVKGNQTNANSNWYIYNTAAIPGAITAITVSTSGSGSFQNNLYAAVGTSSQSSATSGTAGGTDPRFSWTFSESSNYTYFKLVSNQKFTNGSVTGVTVTVTYNATTPATEVSISKGDGSQTDDISEKTITIEKDSGTNSSLSEDLVAAVNDDATDQTVTWSKVDASNLVSEWAADDNEVLFDIDTSSTGTFTVTATADGGTDVTDTITYRIIDSSEPQLTGVTISGTPTYATQYEGNDFDPSGLTFTPVYDKQNDSPATITGNDIEWNELVAGESPTGIYTSNGQNFTVIVTSVTVVENTLTVTISGSMTKTTYAQSDSWDATGLTKSATYADGTSYSGEITWSYSPASPSGLEVGEGKTVTVTATAASGETASKTVTVTITEPVYDNDFNIVSGGQYVIHHTRSDVTYYLKQNGTTAAPSATTNSWEATIFTFTLTGNNEFQLSCVIDDSTYYLYSTATNNGVRFATNDSTANAGNDRWTLSGPDTTSDRIGSYCLYSAIGSRYLSLYSAQDFRGYTTSNANNRQENTDLTLYDAAAFSNDITAATDTVCAEGYDNVPSSFTSLWSALTTDYGYLSSSEKAALLASSADASGTDVQKAMKRYDYLVGKYGLTDFIGRKDTEKWSYAGAPNIASFGSQDGKQTGIVVVTISMVGVALATGFAFLRRRKENN